MVGVLPDQETGDSIYSLRYPLKQLREPELNKAEMKWHGKQIRKRDMVYTAFKELVYFIIPIYFSTGS